MLEAPPGGYLEDRLERQWVGAGAGAGTAGAGAGTAGAAPRGASASTWGTLLEAANPFSPDSAGSPNGSLPADTPRPR